MAECGCLDDAKKTVVSQVLDTYIQVIEDPVMKKHIEVIKQEIQNCSCKVKKTKSSDGEEKEKKEPSVRNVFMGNCMRGKAKGGDGKGMSECSTLWKEKKNGTI